MKHAASSMWLCHAPLQVAKLQLESPYFLDESVQLPLGVVDGFLHGSFAPPITSSPI